MFIIVCSFLGVQLIDFRHALVHQYEHHQPGGGTDARGCCFCSIRRVRACMHAPNVGMRGSCTPPAMALARKGGKEKRLPAVCPILQWLPMAAPQH
eukprot:1353307-Amphidinium_carterae.1